jgi:hypothetical protein
MGSAIPWHRPQGPGQVCDRGHYISHQAKLSCSQRVEEAEVLSWRRAQRLSGLVSYAQAGYRTFPLDHLFLTGNEQFSSVVRPLKTYCGEAGTHPVCASAWIRGCFRVCTPLPQGEGRVRVINPRRSGCPSPPGWAQRPFDASPDCLISFSFSPRNVRQGRHLSNRRRKACSAVHRG